MKIVLYMATTVNGFIARENDDTPWAQEIWDSYYKIAKKFNALILGRRTYEIMKDANEFDKIGTPFTIVITKQKKKNDANFVFVKSPKEAIDLLNGKGFDEALLGGGGTTNSSFMKDNLVDELILDIEPMILSSGIKLFEGNNFEAKLSLLRTDKISKNVVQLRYKVLSKV